jgi:hypothetical protein
VVEAHRTKVLYRLTADDVDGVVRRTDHALGKIAWSTVEPIKNLINWNPDFAFTHMFAHMVERLGEIPTWQRFFDFVMSDDLGRSIGDQARAAVDAEVAHGVERKTAQNAAQWRMGNAYYGLLREAYVIIHLRARGLDVRCHPLADALFHADTWCGRAIVSIRVANENLSSGENGRKTRPEQLLADAEPSFRFVTLEMGPATGAQRGKPHLPDRHKIPHLAHPLNGAAATG